MYKRTEQILIEMPATFQRPKIRLTSKFVVCSSGQLPPCIPRTPLGETVASRCISPDNREAWQDHFFPPHQESHVPMMPKTTQLVPRLFEHCWEGYWPEWGKSINPMRGSRIKRSIDMTSAKQKFRPTRMIDMWSTTDTLPAAIQ